MLGAVEIERLDRAVRDLHAPTPTVRRIVVTSLESGAGTSTVATLLARTLGRHRGGRVLLAGSPAPAGDFSALRPPNDAEQAMLPAEARALVRPWHDAWRAVDPVDDRGFDVSVYDLGRTADPMRAPAALAGAHAVVLVAGPARTSGENALALADALAAHPDGAATVVAFSNRARSRSPWPRLICERHPRASVVLPYDRALASGRMAGLSGGTRRGVIALAGDVMVARKAEEAR